MLHDEDTYPDPSTFKPERFLTEGGALDPSILDPATVAFGFGRRSDAVHYPVVHAEVEFMSSLLQDLSRQPYCMVHPVAINCYGVNYDEDHKSTG